MIGDLALLDNGADSLVLHGDGPFTFPSRIPSGETYLVGIDKQPENQVCVIANGQGQATADVSNVAIHCADSRSDLATLEVTQGTVAARMTPAFAASSTSYVAELHAVSAPSVDVTFTTVAKDAVVVVDGKPVDPSMPVSYPPLEVGSRTVDVLVTSPAGNSQSHYTIALGAIARYFKPDGLTLSNTGFGTAMAASTDRLFVGGPNETAAIGATVGAINIYHRVGGIWTEEAKLVPSTPDDSFGSSLAVDGDTLIVGRDTAPIVYRLGPTGWAVEQDLTSLLLTSEAATGAVAIVGDTAVSAGASSTGQILVVFHRSGTTWTRDPAIQAPAGAPDGFATSLAIGGTPPLYFYAGSPGDGVNGTVYVFQRKSVPPRVLWTTRTPITPPASDVAPSFGTSIAISGNTIVVGAPDENTAGTGVDPSASTVSVRGDGAVYLYDTGVTSATLLHKLKAPVTPGAVCPTDCYSDFAFGSTVAFDGTRLVVSAVGDKTRGSGFGVAEGAFDIDGAGGTVRLYSVDTSVAITPVAAIRSPNPTCATRFGSNVVLTPDGFAIADQGEACTGTGVEPNPALPGGPPRSGAVYDYLLP